MDLLRTATLRTLHDLGMQARPAPRATRASRSAEPSRVRRPMAIDRPSPLSSLEEGCESYSGPDLPKWPASQRRPRTTTFRSCGLAKAPSSLPPAVPAAPAAPAAPAPPAEVADAASSFLVMHNSIFQEIDERFTLLSRSGSQPPPLAMAKQGYLSSGSQAADTPDACAHLNGQHCPISLDACSSHVHYRCASHKGAHRT